MTRKREASQLWVVTVMLGLCTFLSCQKPIEHSVAPLPDKFTLSGRYAIQSIQIDPPLKEGDDVMAFFVDSTGQSSCLQQAIIQFNPDGWITFTKPAGCEQNDDLTDATGLRYGNKWALQDNTLVVDDLGKTTQYAVSVDQQQVILSLAIEQGYASTLEGNSSGYTLTITLNRL